jgi:hypothetical protein
MSALFRCRNPQQIGAREAVDEHDQRSASCTPRVTVSVNPGGRSEDVRPKLKIDGLRGFDGGRSVSLDFTRPEAADPLHGPRRHAHGGM